MPNLTPSRTRYGVVVFAILLAIIHYIDRVCISKAQPFIEHDLKLDDTQMGLVFSSFTLAYALFEIPGGWLGDCWGPKRVLLRIVGVWSFFTAATGAAWNLTSMMVCRFLFGVGEAGGFPNITKMFSIWLPHREQGVAQGITWLAARWGGAFTPLLVVAVMNHVSWRIAFVMFAGLGVLWAIAFYIWFRDNPREHKGVNAAELALLEQSATGHVGHASIPWRRLITCRSVLLLWLYYFCVCFVWYFYITWLPKYMDQGLGLDMKSTYASILNGFPLFFGGIGCYVGGLLARRLTRTASSLSMARRWVGGSGMLLAGACLYLATLFHDPTYVMLAMGFSSFFNDLSMACSWGACMDIGGPLAGSVSGSMNMVGNLGGAVVGVTIPWLMKVTHNNWPEVLILAGAVYLIAATCWLFIDSDDRLTTEGSLT